MEQLEENSSIFGDALMGQLLSTLQCDECKTESHTFEAFYVLELPVPEQPEATLQDCLFELGKTEILEGPVYYCSQCKCKRQASKTLKIWKLPPVLIVYLKRFSSNDGVYHKNGCLVKTALEGSDLSGYISDEYLRSKGPAVYAPFGFIHHRGSHSQGHYTCSVRNSHNGQWVHIDDATCRTIPVEKHALFNSPQNYLIFLQRTDLVSVGSMTIPSNWPFSPEIIAKVTSSSEEWSPPEIQSFLPLLLKAEIHGQKFIFPLNCLYTFTHFNNKYFLKKSN